MSATPQVTVIVPTFNRALFLAECLDSLLTQTLPACQLIVVNDGSTDDTPKILDGYRGRVEVLETAQTGKANSINAALPHVRGAYVWIFDDDDVALPDALERFVEPLEKNPQYGYSFSSFFFTESRPDKRIGQPAGEYKLPDLESRGPLIPLLEANYLGGAALFARTSCYREVGLFDPKLVRSQDYEMAIRIVRRFRGTAVRGGPTFHYRQHEEWRGTARERFRSDSKLKKWLEYDQIIFRRLYRELDLSEYVAADVPAQERPRLAMLQRLAVMAGRRMTAEAVADLRLLAETGNDRPLTWRERAVARCAAASCWYLHGESAFDDPGLLSALREQARRSPFIRALRRELLKSTLAQLLRHPNPRGLVNALWLPHLFL